MTTATPPRLLLVPRPAPTSSRLPAPGDGRPGSVRQACRLSDDWPTWAALVGGPSHHMVDCWSNGGPLTF